MEFYRDALGAELDLQTVGESPMAKQMPDKKDNVMHSTLKKGDHVILMASDMLDEEGKKAGNNFSLSVDTESEEETKEIFAKLSRDGKVGQELKEQFWGGIYGDLTDKFGFRWMFNFQKKPYNPKA